MFEYFKNPSMEQGQSVKAAQGQAGPGGASTSVIDLGGGLDAPKSAPQEDNGLGQPTVNDRLTTTKMMDEIESYLQEVFQSSAREKAGQFEGK
jgi:chemotaxis protein MotB